MDLEQRLAAVEAECFNNKQRRQLDAYITAALFNSLVQRGLITATDLRTDIRQLSNNLKALSNNDADFSLTVDEHINKLLEQIKGAPAFTLKARSFS